ncbi:hypothetical protein NQ317_014831 [Molorchus minor]|uniref:Uncharacterized protein n=1 Tax=Molorchus minor TaxID=1323400 RepID=A0ABQ9JUV5_9CUCU|nr:hypothetical protein NQ317_014831 [Molorchus minor]
MVKFEKTKKLKVPDCNYYGFTAYFKVPIKQIVRVRQVKILYLRNLDVSQEPADFYAHILQFAKRQYIEKIFKFKNYAFVHLNTRETAEQLKMALEDFYKNTPVEVAWAKPPNKYTTQDYRQKKVSVLSSRTNFSPKFFQSAPSGSNIQGENKVLSEHDFARKSQLALESKE